MGPASARSLPGGFGLELRSGRRSGVRLKRPSRRSRRAPAKPTAPSGSSAAAPGTSCATTTSTGSGRRASSGGATWTAVSSGRSAGARRLRCAREAGVGARPGRPSAQATLAPAPGPGILESTAEGLPLFVLFLFEKYQKLVHQLGFQTLKDKEVSGEWFGKAVSGLSAGLQRR